MNILALSTTESWLCRRAVEAAAILADAGVQ